MRNGVKLQVSIPIEAPPEKPLTNREKISGYNPLKGIQIGNLSPALTDQLGKSPFLKGVMILNILNGSPAQQFGFRRYDIIKRLNGIDIKRVRQLSALLLRKPSQWKISIDRGGKILSMTCVFFPDTIFSGYIFRYFYCLFFYFIFFF